MEPNRRPLPKTRIVPCIWTIVPPFRFRCPRRARRPSPGEGWTRMDVPVPRGGVAGTVRVHGDAETIVRARPAVRKPGRKTSRSSKAITSLRLLKACQGRGRGGPPPWRPASPNSPAATVSVSSSSRWPTPWRPSWPSCRSCSQAEPPPHGIDTMAYVHQTVRLDMPAPALRHFVSVGEGSTSSVARCPAVRRGGRRPQLPSRRRRDPAPARHSLRQHGPRRPGHSSRRAP